MRAILALLLCGHLALGAITADTSIDGGLVNSGATTMTTSYTVGGGCTNAFLFVAVVSDLHLSDPTYIHITGVTFDGSSLTNLGNSFAPADRNVQLFGMFAPTSGSAKNIVVTNNAGGLMSTQAASYCGVNQSVTMDATNTQSVISAIVTGSLTTVANNAWTFMATRSNTAQPTTSGGTHIVQSSANAWAISDSNAAITPAGATTLANTCAGCTGAATWGAVMVSFAPAAPAPTFISNPTIITVGP